MTTVTIHRETEPARLFCLYRSQQKPQDTHIELDCRDGQLVADYDGEIGNAVPIEVWNGHVRRYSIPLLQAETANSLMDEIAPLAQRVVDGYDSTYNGHNYVAILDDDAKAAEDEIEQVIAGYEPDLYWGDASDELYFIKGEIIDRLKGGTTVDELINEYEGTGVEDDPILTGLRPHLEYLAEEAREEE